MLAKKGKNVKFECYSSVIVRLKAHNYAHKKLKISSKKTQMIRICTKCKHEFLMGQKSKDMMLKLKINLITNKLT